MNEDEDFQIEEHRMLNLFLVIGFVVLAIIFALGAWMAYNGGPNDAQENQVTNLASNAQQQEPNEPVEPQESEYLQPEDIENPADSSQRILTNRKLQFTMYYPNTDDWSVSTQLPSRDYDGVFTQIDYSGIKPLTEKNCGLSAISSEAQDPDTFDEWISDRIKIIEGNDSLVNKTEEEIMLGTATAKKYVFSYEDKALSDIYYYFIYSAGHRHEIEIYNQCGTLAQQNDYLEKNIEVIESLNFYLED